jgi:hypothetical protein
VTGISFEDPSNRVGDAVLHVEGDNLPCGRWEIQVTSHGLESGPARLDVLYESGPCRAEIVRFEASPDSIRVSPDGTVVTLEWEVFKAGHVSITSDILGEVFSQDYETFCIAHKTDSLRITLNQTHTFTLEAYAGAGDPVTTETLRVRARDSETEREIIGARRISVQNCHRDGYPLRLVVNDLTDGTFEDLGELSGGYDDWGSCAGEVETIELTDAHVYLITGFYEDDPIAPGVAHIRAVLGDSDGIDCGWSMTGSGWVT